MIATQQAAKTEVKVEDGLKSQMAEMSLGFEDIVKAREEAKRKLQEQFDGVYARITENKEYGKEQSEYIHHTLNEFQEEFNHLLTSLYDNLNESIDVESKYMMKEMDLANQRWGELEKMLQQEKLDRIKDTTDTLDPVRAQIKGLEEELDFEVKYTVKMEKRLLKDVAKNIDEQHNVIKQEKEERTERLNDIYDMLEQDVQLQNKFFDQFEEKALAEFNKMIEEVEKELESRLNHQDNILKDLKFFVEKFGETMKVIGKDV